LVTSELIESVRQLLDEENNASVDDKKDIIPALNRALRKAASILSKHYEAPLLTRKTVSASELSVPEDAFQDRVEKLESVQRDTFYPIKRISYRDASTYESSSTAIETPTAYSIIARELQLYPNNNTPYPVRIWYMKKPDPIVLEQGTVTAIGSNYLAFDNLGSEISTSADDLESFVNLVDGQTGVIKATMQILSIEENRIYFRSTPTREKVFNRQLVGVLPATIELEDYLCSAAGSCIPILQDPLSDYMLRYAVADIQGSLGGDIQLTESVKRDMEQEVERSWAGRETELRVKKVSANWDRPRRWPRI
jgi:hypothetical protein